MPTYSFIHPDSGEEKEIVQNMGEPHFYVDENGVEWKRQWTLPNAQIDADIDPFDKQAFERKTSSQKGSFGDLLDRSKDLSEKRKKARDGKDPVKEQYAKEYSEKRRGRTPPPQLLD